MCLLFVSSFSVTGPFPNHTGLNCPGKWSLAYLVASQSSSAGESERGSLGLSAGSVSMTSPSLISCLSVLLPLLPHPHPLSDLPYLHPSETKLVDTWKLDFGRRVLLSAVSVPMTSLSLIFCLPVLLSPLPCSNSLSLCVLLYLCRSEQSPLIHEL